MHALHPILAVLPVIPLSVADTFGDQLKAWATLSQAFAGILTGLIAVLGVPLALRQVISLQREVRRSETTRARKLDVEANLNITAHYSLTHAALPDQPDAPSAARARRNDGETRPDRPPTPAPQPGKRVLRLDLTLENVGEGTV
ncbi:MAG TPA: hypothetical protein VIG30_18140, partial [Ktedonobacterales bacterium]